MIVEFTEIAAADLDGIHDYIAQANAAAALRTVQRLHDVISKLTIFPELGRAWEKGPTRAISVAGQPYRIHYQVSEDRLIILRVYHTSLPPPVIDIIDRAIS